MDMAALDDDSMRGPIERGIRRYSKKRRKRIAQERSSVPPVVMYRPSRRAVEEPHATEEQTEDD